MIKKLALFLSIKISEVRGKIKNSIYFFIFDIKKSKKVVINGSLFMRIYGQLILAENVKINSGFVFNPIGGQSFTSLVVYPEGILEIKKGAAISNSAFFCSNRITVEENAMIGGDCKIYDTDFHSINPNIRLAVVDTDIKSSPVFIGKRAFIGTGTIILKGVCIGENSIIGAGSVVSKNIPDNEIWAGNPIRFIKKIENSCKEKNL